MKKKPRNSKELPNFEKDVMALVRYIEKTWDGTRDIKPKGYDALMNDYNDWDGMDDFDAAKEVDARHSLRRAALTSNYQFAAKQ